MNDRSEDKGVGVGNHVCSGFCEEIDGQNRELVSVIIPAFNAAANIRQTLDSVLAQTYKAFEVIVVDDGSSDGTSAIVEEFVRKDSRFQIIHQSNKGVGEARNAGIRKARGQYIAPLDADDLWFPEKLEKQVARLARGGPETGLVYCWSELIDEHGQLMGLSNPYKFEGRLGQVLILTCIFGNASVPLFRTAALQKVGPYLTRTEQRGAQGCEDWDLALRIAELFNIGVVPEYLVAYRQTNSSMTVDAKSMATSYAVTMGRARQRNGHLPSGIFRWSAGYFSLYLLNKCYHWGYYSRCLRYLKEAAWSNPFLLLKTEVYRKLTQSLLRLATGQIPDHLLEKVQPSPNKKENGDGLRPKKERKRPFISNRIFRRVELSRWSTAMHDRA